MDFDLAEQNLCDSETAPWARSPRRNTAPNWARCVVDAGAPGWCKRPASGTWDGVLWQPAAPEGRAVIRVAVAQRRRVFLLARRHRLPRRGRHQPPPYAGRGVSRAAAVGYAAQPAVPPTSHWSPAARLPGITFRMLLWALLWFSAAYAVHALPECYALVRLPVDGLGALGALMWDQAHDAAWPGVAPWRGGAA